MQVDERRESGGRGPAGSAGGEGDRPLSIDLTAVQSAEIHAMVERATAGDRHAAAMLVGGLSPVIRRRIASALFRRTARRRGTPADLDDLVQETFACLFHERGRALRAWDPARGLGFLGFVGLLADRNVGMAMRNRRRNPWTEEPTAVDSLANLRGAAPSLAHRIEARDQLRRVLDVTRAQITRRGRTYLDQLVVRGRSVDEVARETGASRPSLYAWRTRLLRLLREARRGLDLADGAPIQRAGTARRVPRPLRR